MPKSPLRQLVIQREYCIRKGSLNPISSRVCWISSSVGMMPAEVYIFRTGSPGERYVSKNVRKLMPIRTISICSNLEASCFPPNSPPPFLKSGLQARRHFAPSPAHVSDQPTGVMSTVTQ